MSDSLEKNVLRWGSINPISYVDDEYGELSFNIQGTCKIDVSGEYDDSLKEQVISEILSTTSSSVEKLKSKSFDKLQLELPKKLNEVLVNKKFNDFSIIEISVDIINLTDESQKVLHDEVQSKANKKKVVVKTDEGAKDGQNKCPKCGSSDITLNVNNGMLRCDFCRHEFAPEKVTGLVEDISTLEGQVLGSGAQDIIADTKDVLTFKCSSCGAEVVVDTASATSARCHWCRNVLSVNQQIPNGSIPDVVLPFSVTRDVARGEIEKFVGKRKFFAHPKFKDEFTTENIMGVYFPYMLVDVNGHALFSGEGEHQTRKYYVGTDDKKEARYDADLYHVEREFDITINGLSIESNSDRLNKNASDKTNNIINSIMPFDVENCVRYNANYLKGYTSERRDTNIEQLKGIVDVQAQDIARFAANDSLEMYDRGVRWDNEKMDVKGQQWQAAYLPVWLYSYLQVSGEKKLLHYVAVNARTKETMGSVPIHIPKLLLVSFIVEIFAFIITLILDWDNDFIFLAAGIVFFIIMYAKYRNTGARHTYEKETKKDLKNLRKADDFIKSECGLSNSRISGANNKSVKGANPSGISSIKSFGSSIVDSAIEDNPLASFVKDNIKKK